MQFGKDELWMALQTFAFIVSVGAAFFAWWLSRNTASEERIDDMEKRIDREISIVKNDVGRVQERLNAVPTHQDLAVISKEVQDVGSKVDVLAGEFVGTRHQVNMIHDYLLNGKRS
jgi:hypothetical protein